MAELEELEDLLRPEDDRAWKLAVGATLRRMLAQTTKTNGRVGRLEKFTWAVTGGLSVLAAVVLPLFLRAMLKALEGA